METETPKDAATPDSKPLSATILAAEDHPVNAMFIERLLRKNGFTVHCVQNGEEVLKAVAKQHYDLILMDIAMPLLDGVETTKRLRAAKNLQTSPDVPIIAMTAHAMKGDREQCLAAGMDDYVSKPVRIEELCAAIERSLPSVLRKR